MPSRTPPPVMRTTVTVIWSPIKIRSPTFRLSTSMNVLGVCHA